MKNTLVILFTIMIGASIYGQDYYSDVLRYSQSNHNYGASARMRALGGASVALGADLTSAVRNPAGLGMYNRSDFFFTPSINFIDSKNTFLGETQRAFKTNFNLANVGVGINFNKGEYSTEKFKGGTVAFTISRQNNFHLMRTYSGTNKDNSLIDYIAKSGSDLQKKAAYEQYLISKSGSGYEVDIDGTPTQSETIKERGSSYKMNLAWGGNYNDIFYFGGGIGYETGNYKVYKNYEETNFKLADGSDSKKINAITLDETLKVRQNGFDFNFGLLVRPIEYFSIGASYTSPTFNTFRDSSFFDLHGKWKNGVVSYGTTDTLDLSTIEPYQSDITTAKYQIRTPGKLSVGSSIFLGKYGFLTGDVEFIDYKSALIQSNSFSTNQDNKLITNNLQNVMNLRFGAEIKIEDIRLRGGYTMLKNPVKNSAFDGEQIISGGIGYRPDDFYVDFTVTHSSNKYNYLPYGNNPSSVNTDASQLAFTATVGFTFE